MKLKKLMEELEKGLANGCRFASFIYRSRDTEETALYVIALGVSIENAYRRDLELLPAFKATTNAQKRAKAELIESLNESLEKGIGNNSRYTQKGLHWHVGKGVRINRSSAELDLFGFIISKEVVKRGVQLLRNPSEKALAKAAYRKRMKSGKFRNFLLTPHTIAGIRFNGKLLEIYE